MPIPSVPNRGSIALKCLISAVFLLAARPILEAATPSTLKWQKAHGYRWAELNPAAPAGKAATGFTLLSPGDTGIQFTNTLDEREGEANRVLFNGSGVALGDFDNDGLPDIYFCSLNGRNALYKNLGGWKFRDVTAESKIICTNQFCRGAVFSDVNADGKLDLLVATTGQGVFCFLNNGDGTFTDATKAAGTGSKFGSVTMALADVDGNGTLDLYVADNRTDDIRDRGQVDIQMVRGKLVIPPHLTNRLEIVNGKLFEFGEPDFLYLNDGAGHFTPVSWTSGAFLDESGKPLSGPPLDWGLTATFRDMNGDGAPDIYVCNDYWTPDRIWINDGKGHFRAIATLALRNTSASSMGIDFADLTRNGRMDFFVVDMLSRDPRVRKRQMLAQRPRESGVGEIETRPQIMRNTLAAARGDGTYAEIAEYAGVPASEWSWSPVFVDVDLDGYEDLLITTGHVKDVQDLDASIEIKKHQSRPAGITDPRARHEAFIRQKLENAKFYPHLNTPIVAFHNLGQFRFEEMTDRWGTDQPGVHHAIALADLDGDGDLDLVVNNLNSAAGIYRNDAAAPRVAVRLKGLAPNTQGIGAKVKLLGGAVPMQSQEIISGGRYMAGSDAELAFAAGSTAAGMKIEVQWRNGKKSVIHDVKANCIYEADEHGAAPLGDSLPSASSVSHPSPELTMFEDASSFLAASYSGHTETAYNDFERQPLLPRKLSQLGPGAAWGDIDGDGWEDLVIGSGQGGQLTAFRNNHQGGFERLAGAPWNSPVPRDQTSILFLEQSGSAPILLTGSANYEDGHASGSAVRAYHPGQPAIDELIPATGSSVGPLALADMDGNGTLDLFVGGRVVPARYPEPASSYIYRNDNGVFRLDPENSHVLENAGLVSGAVWSDLDQDGFPELILACEWGPVRVYQNRKGKLSEVTKALGLDSLPGLWTSVTTADVDGDGNLDIIAGNWGLNTRYHASSDRPLRIFYGDFDNNGVLDIMETEFDPALKTDVPSRSRDALMRAFPDLAIRFPTYRSYSEATTAQVLGGAPARELHATTLASTVFLNKGGRFVAIPLPLEAQLSPVFSINATDFDGDGREDLFLSQNFFDNEAETPRSDAGRGLLLLGGGDGNFKAVFGQTSGIEVYGEQRGAAVADFDHDGRPDLLVTQNGAPAKLYRNRSAKPGVRIKLENPAAKFNPAALGAIIRAGANGKYGPAREIHGGSGYFSQDSAEQILPVSSKAGTELWVRWPGGKTNVIKIPEREGSAIIRPVD